MAKKLDKRCIPSKNRHHTGLLMEKTIGGKKYELITYSSGKKTATIEANHLRKGTLISGQIKPYPAKVVKHIGFDCILEKKLTVYGVYGEKGIKERHKLG